MATKTFLERVMAFITGGDEGKISRFQKRGISQLKQTVSALEAEIDTLNLKKDDAVEAQGEALINIKVERLGSVEQIDAYFVEFLREQQAAEKKVTDINEEIKKVNDKIAEAKKLIARLS